MTRRFAALIALIALVSVIATGALLSGCTKSTVSVKTGERVMCTFGEEISSTVKTLRVDSSEAGKYSVRTRTVTCDKHAQLQKLYSEAQTALGTQDFTTAKAKLAEVVKLDATYKLASKQLDELENGGEPDPDETGGSPEEPAATDPGDQEKPEGPVASLLVYTPDSLSGFRAQKVGSDAFSVSRQYVPTAGGAISLLTIVAEQHRSAQAASAWLATYVKGPYSKSSSTVQVGGHSAYLATDGRRFAIIAWTNGQVVVAIEADAGANPAGAFEKLKAIAGGLPR